MLNRTDPTRGQTQYPLSERNKRVLRALCSPRQPFQPPQMRTRMHWSSAVATLRRENDPWRLLSPRQSRALKRLQALRHLERWHPDIFLKTFIDIDTLLFGGRLQKNVALRWAIEPSKQALAFTMYPGAPLYNQAILRPVVAVNVPYIASALGDINTWIAVMIHESCHAILMVMCGAYVCDDCLSDDGMLDLATVDRWNIECHGGHARSFIGIRDAVTRRLGRNRFVFVGMHSADPNGSIAPGTALEEYWEEAGKFRTKDHTGGRRLRQLRVYAQRQLRVLFPKGTDKSRSTARGGDHRPRQPSNNGRRVTVRRVRRTDKRAPQLHGGGMVWPDMPPPIFPPWPLIDPPIPHWGGIPPWGPIGRWYGARKSTSEDGWEDSSDSHDGGPRRFAKLSKSGGVAGAREPRVKRGFKNMMAMLRDGWGTVLGQP